MGKRWIDFWLVFISFNFEMRFDNFTRATCIAFISLSQYAVERNPVTWTLFVLVYR